jgi:anti-anti-sigma factor
MKLSLVSIEKDGLVRVAAEGPITAADFHTGERNPFEAVLGENWRGSRALLNMTDVTYIDSSAIGWLIGSSKSFKDGGGSLVIHSVQPGVRQILDVLKIGRIVPLVENEPAAREMALGGGT